MPSTAIYCGILLIVVGIVGAGSSFVDGTRSFTALIPLVFGIVIAAIGWFAKTNENLRKHLMHGAVMIALIGFILVPVGLAMRGFFRTWQVSNWVAFLAQIAMALICLAFVILSVRSFIEARRSGAV